MILASSRTNNTIVQQCDSQQLSGLIEAWSRKLVDHNSPIPPLCHGDGDCGAHEVETACGTRHSGPQPRGQFIYWLQRRQVRDDKRSSAIPVERFVNETELATA